MNAILIFFHCPANTGFAMNNYERTFFDMATALVSSPARIHFAFTDLSKGRSGSLPPDFGNVVEIDPTTTDRARLQMVADYLRANEIDFAFGVDQPVRSRPLYNVMRKAGVRRIVSHWGAPMSSPNHGVRLLLKRLDVLRHRAAPEHFIFESTAMARAATHGRGIPAHRVSIVNPAIDTTRFAPEQGVPGILQSAFGIPTNRRVVFYSGHMEERKGVHVLIRAAIELVDRRRRQDFHLLLLGNRVGEEARFLQMLANTDARHHVTFGGYRQDVHAIQPMCYAGAIASTGWDSFPISSIEMAASGLPVLVSDLQGLPETIAHGETGYVFPTGHHAELADRIEQLLDDQALRDRLANASCKRARARFEPRRRITELANVCRSVTKSA